MSPDVRTVLAEAEWQRRRAEHEQRVQPWVEPRLARTSAGKSHPVDDFLFDYYPYSAGRLRTWHPGLGVALAGAADDYLTTPAYVRVPEGVIADPSRATFPAKRLDLALQILHGTSHRAPVTGCFALHEWAMVYGLEQEQVRHSTLPLRLEPAAIRDTVDAIGLRCTHIDAYRFFTEEARPLNSLAPTRATQPDLEQPGCLHATMDLYKYAMWFTPFVAGELVADCFALARACRTLDMRASPYVVAGFGLEAIRVETPDGRRRYADEQARMMAVAEPLRLRLTQVLEDLRVASGLADAVAG